MKTLLTKELKEKFNKDLLETFGEDYKFQFGWKRHIESGTYAQVLMFHNDALWLTFSIAIDKKRISIYKLHTVADATFTSDYKVKKWLQLLNRIQGE